MYSFQNGPANRRQFLTLAAAGGALAATGAAPRAQAQVAARNARIVIIGARAGGTALANRLVQRLEGARITLLDPRAAHRSGQWSWWRR